MKHWRCDHCKDESPWETYTTESFCRVCGKRATRIFEFGCFECDDEGKERFWDVAAPSHPCPNCGQAAYRIVEAPWVSKSGARDAVNFANSAVESELERAKVSLTSMKREMTPKAPSGPSWGGMNGWVGNAINNVKMPDSVLPFQSKARPQTIIVASSDGNKAA